LSRTGHPATTSHASVACLAQPARAADEIAKAAQARVHRNRRPADLVAHNQNRIGRRTQGFHQAAPLGQDLLVGALEARRGPDDDAVQNDAPGAGESSAKAAATSPGASSVRHVAPLGAMPAHPLGHLGVIRVGPVGRDEHDVLPQPRAISTPARSCAALGPVR